MWILAGCLVLGLFVSMYLGSKATDVRIRNAGEKQRLASLRWKIHGSTAELREALFARTLSREDPLKHSISNALSGFEETVAEMAALAQQYPNLRSLSGNAGQMLHQELRPAIKRIEQAAASGHGVPENLFYSNCIPALVFIEQQENQFLEKAREEFNKSLLKQFPYQMISISLVLALVILTPFLAKSHMVTLQEAFDVAVDEKARSVPSPELVAKVAALTAELDTRKKELTRAKSEGTSAKNERDRLKQELKRLRDRFQEVSKASNPNATATQTPSDAIRNALIKILDILPGKVTASSPGETIVNLTLEMDPPVADNVRPLLKQHALWVEQPAKETPKDDADPDKIRILIAEDDSLCRQLLTRILSKQEDWEITAVEDGNQAWERIDGGFVPDLLVSDILMPGLDGHQLLRRVRDDMRFKHLKFIFCTSSSEQSDIEKAGAEGVNRYLIKPYDPEVVIQTIEEELATRTDYVEVAQKRLNMEREEYLIIARSLSDEASKTVIDARNEFANGKHPLARIRLNALKGACLTLGSEELAARAELLCQAIDSGKLSHIMGEFDALEKLVLQFHDTINMMSRTKLKHKKQAKAEAVEPAAASPTPTAA